MRQNGLSGKDSASPGGAAGAAMRCPQHRPALFARSEDGIDSLIGPPPGGRRGSNLNLSLSDNELDDLDDFLADGAMQETSMDL